MSNTESNEKSKNEMNKELIRELFAASDRGDLQAVVSFYSTDYYDHDPSESRSHPVSHFEGVRRAFAAFYAAFPDTRHVVHDLIAEDDKVVVRVSAEATHTGIIGGFAPTGKRIRNDSVVIYRIKDHKIVERWCREHFATNALLEDAIR